MKKKLLIASLLVMVLVCIFAIGVSAASSEDYIEFKVKLAGQENYITAYSLGAAGGANPKLSFSANFYTDDDMTQLIDKDDIIGVDLSSAVTHNCSKDYVEYVSISKLNNCEEFFWLSVGQTSIPMVAFENWTNLKRFDLGCATYIDGKAFKGSGLESIVLPSTITTLKSSAFYNCTNLKSVKFECAFDTNTTIIEGSVFYGCSALTSLDLGPLTKMGESMFENCTALTSLTIPATYNGHTNKNAFKGCTSLKSVDLGGIKYTGESMFANCTSLTDVTVTSSVGTFNASTFAGCTSLTSIELPSSLKTIQSCTFENTGFVYFKMPDTVTTLGYGIFQSCKNLTYVELSATPGMVRDKMFNGCKNLKAVSIPEGVTKIESMAFYGCTSLKAVYLPSTLTQIGSNTNWNQGAFSDSTNFYFVSSAFSVKDENGNWLGDNFVMPNKPEIYYMPSGLTTIYGGEFQSCKYMNPTIVFPTSLKSISYSNGPFVATGEKQNMTYIFLGDIETFGSGMQGNRYKNISLVFANKNDTSLSSIETWSMADIAIGSSSNFTAYFCAGKVSYDLGSIDRSGLSGTYTVKESDFTKTTYTDENQPHFIEAKATKLESATCTKDAGTYYYCFCGAIADSETIEGTALGHEQGELISKYFPLVENGDGSRNYFTDMVTEHSCTRCTEILKGTEDDTALFNKGKGYSVPEDGTYNISHTIIVNKENVLKYETLTGSVVNYGIVAAVGDSLGTPITVDNGEIKGNGNQALVGDMTGTKYTKLVVRISNVPENTEVNCNAYVVFNKQDIFYLCGGTVTKTAIAKSL